MAKTRRTDKTYVLRDEIPPGKKPFSIVGACCHCGAPIYGHSITTEDKPEIRYSK